MNWIKKMFGARRPTEGQKRADDFLSEVEDERLEVRKLTHSLRHETRINHLGARIRLASEVKRDTK